MTIQISKLEMIDVSEYHLPRYAEIPTVGLYLNQVAKFMNEYLAPLGDMSITESMISNYVKKHMISAPSKKQYNREQIARLIFIAIAKSVLSMNQIQLLLDLQIESYDNNASYDYFCSEFENALHYIFGINDRMEEIEEGASDVQLLLRNVIISVVRKIYLDQCFKILDNK